MSVVALSIVLALPITELVIGAKYLESNECANARVVAPAMWLFVSGIVSITLVVTSIGTLVRMMIKESGRETAVILYLVLRVLWGMFSVAWSIVGAVSIWRDNTHCHPHELKNMMWVSVIFHLVGAAAMVFGSTDD